MGAVRVELREWCSTGARWVVGSSGGKMERERESRRRWEFDRSWSGEKRPPVREEGFFGCILLLDSRKGKGKGMGQG
jgi:hypothetical protein